MTTLHTTYRAATRRSVGYARPLSSIERNNPVLIVKQKQYRGFQKVADPGR
ncbi:MAG: hypothetical protein J5I59_05315 [Saprospiraceae bacterium]|nr:hypothetical protein [Saprospiraceae bacterium]